MLNTTETIEKKISLTAALHWANQQDYFSLLNGNDIEYPHDGFPTMLAIGAKRVFQSDGSKTFDKLDAFHKASPSWLFGFLGYDLKNELEDLSSQHENHTQFPDACLFEPEHLIIFHSEEVEVLSDNPDWVRAQIMSAKSIESINGFGPANASVSKEDYIDKVQKLRQHIEEGDVYEINYCQEFWGEIHSLNPIAAYLDLNAISPKPFSAFQKFKDQYLLCASPERFMKKIGDQLISQPIKGTIKRGSTPAEDESLKYQLRHDEKELAENMMIVDLVRNDLARSSKAGTVKVEEIFGIYTFEQVHQMISTITAEKRDDQPWIEVLRMAFPMGSMTGAPKIKVMELIEQYENTKRGIFSGAAGYITPEGDFDFNVIIRSLFLDLKSSLYSFQVGSAITYDSVPEKEYEECMVKAKAIFKLIKSNMGD